MSIALLLVQIQNRIQAVSIRREVFQKIEDKHEQV